MLSTAGSQSLESVRSRIIENIETFNAQSTSDWKLGISIGHAELGQDGVNDFAGLIAAADARMYQSRRDKRLDVDE
jgi:GGDEF domain-containing protein